MSTDPPPRVDVGVVTFDTAALVVPALRRTLGALDGVDARLLVRDNGSTDGTPDRIRAEVPEVVLDADGDNLGFGAGMNTLLARSDAPWFLVLNGDAWPRPGAVRRLVATAVAQPQAAAVAPRLERPDGSLEHSTFPFPSVRLAAAMALGGRHLLGPRRAERLCLEGAWAHDRAREVDWAVGAALLLRREAVDAIGGFDERFFMYVEDVEWCLRARRHGWSIRFEPSAVVTHVGGASASQTYGARRTEAHLHNLYRLHRREHGAAATGALRAANLVGSARLWATARLRRDHGAAALWADTVRAHLSPVAPVDLPPT